MPRLDAKLVIGRLKGAKHHEIKRNKLKSSSLGYFQVAYYPRNNTVREGCEGKNEVVFLSDRLSVSSVVPLQRTSKLSVVRRRLVHRLQAAWRLEWKHSGLAGLPMQHMHLVLMPTMRVLTAPFESLKQDVAKTWAILTREGPSVGVTHLPQETASRGQFYAGKKLLPEAMMNKKSTHEAIQDILRSLPASEYIAAHGGARSLLDRLRSCTKS